MGWPIRVPWLWASSLDACSFCWASQCPFAPPLWTSAQLQVVGWGCSCMCVFMACEGSSINRQEVNGALEAVHGQEPLLEWLCLSMAAAGYCASIWGIPAAMGQ